MKTFTYRRKGRVMLKKSYLVKHFLNKTLTIHKIPTNNNLSIKKFKTSVLEPDLNGNNNWCDQIVTLEDFLVNLYKRGFHHILEKIILSLPPWSILVCRQVSEEWNSMINFYHQSSNPRIQLLQEKRLDLEWIRGKPILESIDLPGNIQSFAK